MTHLLSQKLKRWIRQAREGTPVLFYTMPQTYSARFQATVINKLDKTQNVTIILPVPSSKAYQKIEKEPRFFPENAIVGEDAKFWNRYAYWQVKFAPNESKIFKEEFTVTVSPRNINIRSCEDLILSEYPMAIRPDLIGFTNAYIDAQDERVKRMVKEVVGEERRVSEIARRLNEYVITRLVYGNPTAGLYSSRDALEKGKVDCGGFDTLLAALCLAAGIPARIVSGFWAGYEKNDMHAWLEIMLPSGEWIPADPSVEHLRRNGRTKKDGRLGFVGSDRIALSIGCEIPLQIGERGLTVDIIQNPKVIAEKGPDSFTVEANLSTAQRRR